MNRELMILCASAASIGFFHTLLGPDHYLPFIFMGKARGWSVSKTVSVTFLCGLGHICGSVILGIVGVVFGMALMKLEALETFRGNLAAWALIGFGLAYFFWGIRRAIRLRPHRHEHEHDRDQDHSHEHTHMRGHSHVHDKKGNITPWVLFTIFVLGPCEPLIPVLMYPAAKNSVMGLFLVVGIFGFVTLLTMLLVVIIAAKGVSFISLGRLERYSHALAGATICLSGLAIHTLRL